MDFSTISRSLESLRRRTPPLSAATLAHVDTLQQDPTDVPSIQGLLDASDDRWEPLAVGIHVATAVLEGVTTNNNNITVYMDGPRVPATKIWEIFVLTTTLLCGLSCSIHLVPVKTPIDSFWVGFKLQTSLTFSVNRPKVSTFLLYGIGS